MAVRAPTIRPLTISEYQAIVTGIPKNCPNATFGVAGQSFTAATAVAFVESLLNTVAASATAKTGWKDAQLAEEAAVSQNGAVVRGIRDTLATMFSNNTTVLSEFLITPRKPYKPLSTEARAAANAKAAATRLARGTTSKAQKATITGDVTGVTITPVTSGSAPANPAAAIVPALGAGSSSGPATPASPAPAPAPAASTIASPAALGSPNS